MLQRIDYWLAAFVFGINFFLMMMFEGSLFTILPKYFGNYTLGPVENITIVIPSNSSGHCFFQQPPYVIVSIIFLTKNIFMVFLNPVMGIIIEKVNIYLILILGHVSGIIVSIIYAYGLTVWIFAIGRLFDTFVFCSIMVSVYALISRIFEKTEVRDRYFALVNTLYFVSYSLGPIYGAQIDEMYGKSAVFMILVPIWITCSITTFILYWKMNINAKRSPTKNYAVKSDPVEKGLIKPKTEKVSEDCEKDLELTTDDKQPTIKANESDDKVDFKNLKPREKFKILWTTLMKFFKDIYVMACFTQVMVNNLSMFSLPPTLPSWMAFQLCSSETQQGIVWTFGFVGYMFGIGLIIFCDKFAQYLNLYIPMVGHIVVGIMLILLPYSRDWRLVFIPIIGIHVSVGFVDQVILPLSMDITKWKHESNFGVMSSLISQSLTLSALISTLFCGFISEKFGFETLSILLGVVNLIISPISLIHLRIMKNIRE